MIFRSEKGKCLILGFAIVVVAFIAAIALTTVGKFLIKLIWG